MWIEPVIRIGGRLPDRPKDEREREPRRQPQNEFTRALQEAQEQEHGRQDRGGT